jgi:acyl CoA:acetate/3-ketoacid CoA transferase alpha subunit
MMDKRITLQQAVDMVSTGACLGLGGLTLYRRPVMFVRTLVSKFISSGYPKDLTLLAFTAGLESDLLVGAGMISRVRSC